MAECKECLYYEVCADFRRNICETYKKRFEEYKINSNGICDNFKNKADFVEVKHGEWDLEVHSFYADNWDESIELCVYILASCSNCSEKHSPKQVFSKRLYAPEDADDDFRFDQEYEKSKALEEFKQKGYKFQNYCPNCGAKMDKRSDTE